MEIYSHVSAGQQREAVNALEQAIAAESHTESHANRDQGSEEWVRTDQNERESGSGGRIRTYDQAVNSRPLYH